MTAERSFMKINGNILYAGDVNLLWLLNFTKKDATTLQSIHRLPYSQSANTVTLDPTKVHHFSSFSMTGGTLNISQATAGQPLILIVDGDFTFSGGTIDLSDLGFAGGDGNSNQDGDDGTDYSPDDDWNAFFDGAGIKGLKGTSHGTGGAAGTYTKLDGTSSEPDDSLNLFNAIAGAGAGAGGGSSAPAAGGDGGNGGGSIIIIARGDVNMTGGTIDCSGEDGGNGSGSGAAGGGGGAGGMIIIAHGGSYTAGTLTVTGGSAGAGTGDLTNNAGGGGGASGEGSNGTAGAAGTDVSPGAGGNGGNGITQIIDLTP